MFHHYSWYQVKSVDTEKIVLEDLLFNQKRSLRLDRRLPVFQSWRVEAQQLIQARLFREIDSPFYLTTHVWMHLESEKKNLLELASQTGSQWGLHKEMLREALECLIRSYDLSDQLAAVRSQNWVFRDFYKKRKPEKNASKK
jgi:hypothetical protein